MLVAREKAKNNVGEYLIYMFQVEDLIRACKFDPELIISNLVSKYQVDNEQKKEIKDWYLGLAELMEEEKISKAGHLTMLNNKINELHEFHLFLLQNNSHTDYKDIYSKTEQDLKAFATKQKTQNNNVVDLMTNAIYAFYLLKLKKTEVSTETIQSIGKFSNLLGALSKKFKEYEEGKIKVFED